MAIINHLWESSTGATVAGMRYSDDGSTVHEVIGGRKFSIAKPPEGANLKDTPAQVVRDAVEAHNVLALKTHSVESDPNLSTMGRQNELAQPQRVAVFSMSQLAIQLQGYRRLADEREALLFAVPPLNPAHFGEALKDWEIRSWFDKLPTDTQLSVLTRACAAPITGERMIAALLRAPFPDSNLQTKMVNDLWQSTRRASNVTEADAIDAQRQAADWAFVQLASVTSMVVQLCRTWQRADLLQVLLKPNLRLESAGYEIFGFGEREVVVQRRVMEAEAQPN